MVVMGTELCINYIFAGCATLTPDADLCCAIKMRNSDITERFKAFRVRDQQQISFNILLYPSYSDLSISPHRIGIYILLYPSYSDLSISPHRIGILHSLVS